VHAVVSSEATREVTWSRLMDVSLESIPRKGLLYSPSKGHISRTMRQKQGPRLRSLVKARDAVRVVASLKGRQRDSAARQLRSVYIVIECICIEIQ
jgi:hypothetical protein